MRLHKKITSHYPLLLHHETAWLSTSYALASDVELNIQKGEVKNHQSITYVWPRYQKLLLALSASEKKPTCSARYLAK